MRIPVLSVLAILALGAAASADPAPDTGMKAAPPAAGKVPPEVTQKCTQNVLLQSARLDQLETMLTLTPRQQPLFAQWKKIRVDIARDWPCPPPQMSGATTTPERVERQESMMSHALDALRREKPSILALYQALTPQQRDLFDHPTMSAMEAPRAAPAPAADKPKPEAPPPGH